MRSRGRGEWVRAVGMAGVLVLTAACDGDAGSEAAPLTPAEFVAVVTDIRVAERELPDGDRADARFLERRATILERHGVTEEELRAFVDVHAADADLLAEVWDSINHRLRYVPDGEGSGSPDPEEARRPAGPGQRVP